MKASAPNWLAAGSQLLVKIFRPSAVNHDEACWLVETAIQDQDHQHQQAGREREDREGAVAERPPLRKGVGGSGRDGRIHLGDSAHDGESI